MSPKYSFPMVSVLVHCRISCISVNTVFMYVLCGLVLGENTESLGANGYQYCLSSC